MTTTATPISPTETYTLYLIDEVSAENGIPLWKFEQYVAGYQQALRAASLLCNQHGEHRVVLVDPKGNIL
jgi:hypothetical protein